MRAKHRYLTTVYVLGETITYLYPAIGAASAQGFVNHLFTEADAGTYQLIHVSPQQFRRAWQLRQTYDDKPDISFVDFTSVVVMQELGISDIFTGDDHFRQVNVGFHLHP